MWLQAPWHLTEMVATALAPHSDLPNPQLGHVTGKKEGMRKGKIAALAGAAMLAGLVSDRRTAADPAPTLAQLFGKQEDVSTVSLSPDGEHITFVAPATGPKPMRL